VCLVHTATGTPLVDFLEELDISEGVAGQLALPHTDQAGFQDENGNAYVNWYYTARITYSTPSKAKTKAPKIKVFQLATGQTIVDLDALPGGAPALPYTAPIPTVTSVMGLTGAVTGAQIAADPALTATYAPSKVGYDIIIVAGQSNMAGWSLMPSNIAVSDPVNPRIDQWGTHVTLGIKPASEPLDMYTTPAGIGPALQFARWYTARALSPNRKLLIVPVAKGGTPFEGASSPSGFTWKVGRNDVTNLYDNMITQANAAKAAADAIAGTTNTFVGVLWLQGETDGDNGTTGPTYRTDLDALLNGIRTALALSSLPIVVGTMVPEYLTTGTRKAIDAVHRSTPLRFAKADVAIGATGMNKGDGNHYSEAGQRFNGRAFYDAYERIAQGIAPSFTDYTLATPATPTLTNDSTTSLGVAWAAITNATAYIVEYRVTGAGSWTAMSSTTATAISIPGLTLGTSYDVRVTAYNVIGDASTPSAVATKTVADSPAIVLDTFTRADSSTALGTADTGQTWVAGVGTYGISSNKAYPVSAADGDRAVIDCGLTSHKVTATVSGVTAGASGPSVSLLARMTDASNGYVLNIQNQTQQAKLFKIVAGAYTQLGSTVTVALVDGDTISLSVQGSTLTAYKNGASVVTTTDTTFTSGTKVGLRIGASSSAVRYDDFTVRAS
jgi:hypothetical protein